MKAVIAAPPVYDFYFTPSRASALGAEALKTVLESCSIEVEIFNFPLVKKKPAAIPLPAELSYLKPHLIAGEHGPLSFFRKFHRFGPSMESCAEMITEKAPDIVFISCFAWAYADETLSLAAAVKSRNPSLHICAGGAGVSVNPAYFQAAAELDSVIAGEAETAVPAFLAESFGLRTDIVKLPSPGFYRSQTGLSTKKNIRYISAVLSRGCPKSCRFCSNHLVHGKKFRTAGLGDIRQSIERIPDNMNIHINFEDDNLLIDRDFFFKVLQIIKDRFPEAGFSAENGLDYTLMDQDLIRKLMLFGFRSFNLSMASSDSRLLRQEQRAADPLKLESVLNTVSEAGAGSTTYFICGLEGDTAESVLNSLERLHSLPTLTGISMFYPVPGLPGFEPSILAEDPPRLCAGSSARPWTKSLSTKQLITSFRLARLSNLLKTVEGRITRKNGDRQPDCMTVENELIDKIFKTGRLHTLTTGGITEIPAHDAELVKAFIRRIQ